MHHTVLSYVIDRSVDSALCVDFDTATSSSVGLLCRHRVTGDLIAQGSHVEYSAGGAPYPSTIQEYHQQQLSRQQASKL